VTRTELETSVNECTAQVLERMFFLRAHGETESPAFLAHSGVVCEVNFDGSPSGRLAIWVSLQAAWFIAANFLGKDSGELAELEVSQVVCELANMICGAVLSRIESGTTFSLGSPRLLSGWNPSGADALVRLAIPDAGDLAVILSIERPVCPMSA